MDCQRVPEIQMVLQTVKDYLSALTGIALDQDEDLMTVMFRDPGEREREVTVFTRGRTTCFRQLVSGGNALHYYPPEINNEGEADETPFLLTLVWYTSFAWDIAVHECVHLFAMGRWVKKDRSYRIKAGILESEYEPEENRMVYVDDRAVLNQANELITDYIACHICRTAFGEKSIVYRKLLHQETADQFAGMDRILSANGIGMAELCRQYCLQQVPEKMVEEICAICE